MSMTSCFLRLACLLPALLWTLALPLGAKAAGGSASIAAIVGEDAVITDTDVERRMRLVALSSGIDYSPQVAQELFPQVVRLLADEEIYRKEAERLGLSVSSGEVHAAVERLEAENKMAPGSLAGMVGRAGVPYAALERQIEAQLLRDRILEMQIKPRLSVSQAEVDEEMDNIVSKRGYYEVKLSEIVLPVAQGTEDEAIRKAAAQLISRVEGGASFARIAKEFSRAPSASQGGSLAWTGIDKLNTALRAAIDKMDIGQLTNPLKIEDAYHVVRLDDKRAMLLNDDDETEIGLLRIFYPVPDGDEERMRAATQAFGQAKSEYTGGCPGFPELAEQLRSEISPKMSMVQVKTLDKRLLPVLSNLPLGELSPVVKGNSGINLFMICERTKARPTPAARKKIEQLLIQKKGLLQSKRYLQEMRDRYFVEVRG
jgi:peptidyl-prolyl cis-trans isomerase SurA